MLHDASLEARNRAAGGALELFFRLAEAEGKLDILKRSLAEIEDALASGEQMRAKGLQLGDDFEVLRRRRVATLDSNIELELAIDRLNSELRQLLKLGPTNEMWRIWPEINWAVLPEAYDTQAAIALGLEHRPELFMLRKAGNSLTRETAPAIQALLGQADALLGMSCQGHVSLFRKLAVLLGHPSTSEGELVELCRQFQAYRIQREQEVADEIRQAVMTVDARLREVAVGLEEVRGWERRLEELKAKAERGIPTFPERTTVELHRLEAQSDLHQHVAAWHIARVKLSQAQGLLAEQCGFSPCSPAGPH
jgi:hypothetical protein